MKANRKNLLQLFFFLFLMGITFYVVLKNNDIGAVVSAIKEISTVSVILSIFCACFFVAAEGFMIWYLLHSLGSLKESFIQTLPRCIGYSFIGFFFSGITPSATGGQPMQLYYMKKDGIVLSDSTLVLMIVAVLYKFVLTVIGGFLLLFWKSGLENYLGGYMSLLYLGMFLNVLLVLLLLLIMFHGNWMQKLLEKAESLFVLFHLLKPSSKRRESIHGLITGYEDAFRFFFHHKSKILFVCFCTLLQRCSLFFLTFFVYLGLHLEGYTPLHVAALQASVFIAVDMLPLPGSQGISELMYHAVFAVIFPGSYLTASMCITRGLGFYLPLLIGAAVLLCRLLFVRRQFCPPEKALSA